MVSSGIICGVHSSISVSVARVPPSHSSGIAYVLEDEVPRAAIIQRPYPVNRTAHRVHERNPRGLAARQQRVRAHVVGPDPQRVYRLIGIQVDRPVGHLTEIQKQLRLENRVGGRGREVVGAGRAAAGEGEEIEGSVARGVDWPGGAAIAG